MISTHILDTSKGTPAVGVCVSLKMQKAGAWSEIGKGLTNTDGRLVFDCEKTPGTYQLEFEIDTYFKKDGKEFFFMTTPVIFKVEDISRKYHVPLLLNPFGYSTYRGT